MEAAAGTYLPDITSHNIVPTDKQPENLTHFYAVLTHTMSPECPFQDMRPSSSHNYQSDVMNTRVKALTSKTS